MGIDLLKNIARFFLIFTAQVLIVKNLELGRYIHPYIYLMFIIILPFTTPGWLLLTSGFFMGLLIDMFYNSMGMHTAATVLIAFCRPTFLKFFSQRENYDISTIPTSQQMGVGSFLSYCAAMVFTHHLLLFYTEIFRLNDFFYTLLKVLLSSIGSILLIYVSQFFVFRRR